MYGRLLKLDWKSRCHMESWWKALRKNGKLTEGPRDVQKLTKVYRRSCTSTKCWQKVPRTNGKFTEDPADAQKLTEVYRRSCASWSNSPCICGNFCQLPSTFGASMGPTKTFCVAGGISVNFSQLSVRPWDLLSTFRASTRPSVNFLRIRGFLHQP